jgi:hypothetical protein
VTTTCGDPQAQDVQTTHSTETEQVEQWIYDYVPNSPLVTGQVVSRKDAFVVYFKNLKAVEILVEGESVQATKYCRPDVVVSVGDSADRIYQVCQWPSLKQNITRPISQKPVEQMILTYQSSPQNPARKLYFEDFKLVKIE